MIQTKTILIVDDEDIVRKFVHAALSTSGYGELLEAENAAQALEISETCVKPINLLISDIVMPGELDGRDLAKRINHARPETKILLMSGYEDHDGCGRSEGWRFIRKPFLPGALIQTVEQVLGGSAEMRTSL
jgi:DNA-binding NtrC family response regulator